jgi:hypothetical protein
LHNGHVIRGAASLSSAATTVSSGSGSRRNRPISRKRATASLRPHTVRQPQQRHLSSQANIMGGTL